MESLSYVLNRYEWAHREENFLGCELDGFYQQYVTEKENTKTESNFLDAFGDILFYKRILNDFQQHEEDRNFFAPNTKLIVYNLSSFFNLAEIYDYIRQRADFIPPIEVDYDSTGKFLGQVKLNFSTLRDSKRAFLVFNNDCNFPVFAQYGNPNIRMDHFFNTERPAIAQENINFQSDLNQNSNSFFTQKTYTYSPSPSSATYYSSHIPCIASPTQMIPETNSSFGNTETGGGLESDQCCENTELSFGDKGKKRGLQLLTMWAQKVVELTSKGESSFCKTLRDFFLLSPHVFMTLLSSRFTSLRVVSKTLVNSCLGHGIEPNISNIFVERAIGGQERRLLTVSAKTQVKAIAGAIAHTLRKDQCPIILSGGAEGINLSIKAMAIAREYLIEDSITFFCYLEKSNHFGGFRFILLKDYNGYYEEETVQQLYAEREKMLKVSRNSKVNKTASLIQKYALKSGSVSVGAMGSCSVFQTIKAIIFAGKQLQRENFELSFQPRFVSLFIGETGGEKRSVIKIKVKIESATTTNR